MRKVSSFLKSSRQPGIFWFFTILAILAVLGFYQIFSFWFFHGWETSWLSPVVTGGASLTNLMQSHGFVMYFNYLLFGWNPAGWFATALLAHIFVTWMLMYFVTQVTKKLVIGFFSALIFVTTTAHHDVVTWGSFESLYAVQTFGFYTSLLFFYLFRTQKKNLYFLICVSAFLFSSVLRESGLIFIPIVFLFDLIIFRWSLVDGFMKLRFNRKEMQNFLKPHFLFWSIAVIYLLIWKSYGGSPHDYIDERVQFRVLLFHEGRFLEYFQYGFLAFGQFIPPYLIPYTFVNSIKSLAFRTVPLEVIHFYFNVMLGWGMYLVFLILLILQRKSKYFNYLLFCLASFTIIMLFYSFAWTMTPNFFTIPYSWTENRWRYFAFTMLAPFLIISLFWVSGQLSELWQKRKKIFLIAPYIAILAYVIVNFWQLHGIQKEMYLQNHLPSRRFYDTLTDMFPVIDEDVRFYFNRNTPYLNDFFSELQVIRQDFYPNLKNIPAPPWATSDIYYTLNRLKNRENILFADYSVETGVQNRTEEVKRLFDSQRIISAGVSQKNGSFFLDTQELPPVEFRNSIKLTYAAGLRGGSGQDEFTYDDLRALAGVSQNIYKGMTDYRLEVCKTVGWPDEPFYDFRESLAIDGNLSYRSYWWADCRPAWITIDLGEERDISGFTWGSYNYEGAVPRHYVYEVSGDGKDFKPVLEIKENSLPGRVDRLEKNITSRYIRLNVIETDLRALFILNEFTPIFNDSSEIFDKYSSNKDLFEAIYSLWSKTGGSEISQLGSEFLPVVWAKVTWISEPDNQVPIEGRTYYIPLLADGNINTYTFQIPESENYSTQGQFLGRFITGITIEPAPSTVIDIQRAEFIPLQTYEERS